MTQESLAAESALLVRTGHEIKNALHAVLGFTQLMAMDAQDPLGERHRVRLQAIAETAWHMLDVVNDVIEVARVDKPLL